MSPKESFPSWRYETDGSKKSSADVFVMMTQDAMPKDDRLIEKLVEPLQEVAVA